MKPAISLDTLDLATPSGKGFEIELKHPVSKEPLGIFIGVVGRHSERYIAHQRRAANDATRKAAENAANNVPPEPLTVEAMEARGTEALVACMTHWRTGDAKTLNFEGEDRVFTPENARLLLSSIKWTWIRQQVDEAIHRDTSFFKL